MREVERGHHAPDTERAQDRRVVLARIERSHRADEAVVLLHGEGVLVDQVGAFFDLADCLGAVLATFDDQQRGEQELALADQFGRAAHEGDSLLPRSGGPGGVRGTGSSDSGIDVVRGGFDEVAEDLAVIGWGRCRECVSRAFPFAVDQNRIRLTETGFGFHQRGIKSRMHALDLFRSGGICDFLSRFGHYAFPSS